MYVNIKINYFYFLLFFSPSNNMDFCQGLTPTIILVRVSMGLSFHNEKTLADATMMRLYPPETESTVVIIGRRKMINYHDEFNHDDDIEMLESDKSGEKSVDGSML
jgi:hypothetical protein